MRRLPFASQLALCSVLCPVLCPVLAATLASSAAHAQSAAPPLQVAEESRFHSWVCVYSLAAG